MPKPTFLNLDADKRSQFLQAALLEFADKDYEAASISRLVKQLGIAKGSVYQYFEHKLDLWLYLKQHCEQAKLAYAQRLDREAYPDFWTYYLDLYRHGLAFDLEQPLCSRFLYRLGYLEKSPDLAPYLATWRDLARQFFEAIAQAEQARGQFRTDISPALIAHFMLSMSLSLADLLQHEYQLIPSENLAAGRALYGQDEAKILAAAGDLIALMRRALEPF